MFITVADKCSFNTNVNKMEKAEYFVGTSKNVDKKLHLSDVINSTSYLNDEESISKFYEIVEINDIDGLRNFFNGGRCTYCHANLDKTCGIKVVKCLNGTKTCYRRKYCL